MNSTQSKISAEDRFNEFGRCIPVVSQDAVHQVSRRYFQIQKSTSSISEIYERLTSHIGSRIETSEDEFKIAIDRIRSRIESDPELQNMLNGDGIPFIIPRIKVVEIGTLLEDQFIPAVARSYTSKFASYSFTNHVQPGLAGKLSVREGSRHGDIIDAMSKRDVVGIYFPCLTEYSIPACIRQLTSLPADFSLSGGFDICAALVGTPELLLRTQGYAPMLWLGGLSTEKPMVAYHFEAYGYNLTFNRRAHLDAAAEYWWNGLTLIDRV